MPRFGQLAKIHFPFSQIPGPCCRMALSFGLCMGKLGCYARAQLVKSWARADHVWDLKTPWEGQKWVFHRHLGFPSPSSEIWRLPIGTHWSTRGGGSILQTFQTGRLLRQNRIREDMGGGPQVVDLVASFKYPRGINAPGVFQNIPRTHPNRMPRFGQLAKIHFPFSQIPGPCCRMALFFGLCGEAHCRLCMAIRNRHVNGLAPPAHAGEGCRGYLQL